MKKRVVMLVMLCLMSLSFADEPTVWVSGQKQMTPHQAYVLVKEMVCAILIMSWWLDEGKIRQAKVYCDACNHSMDSKESYGYLVAMGDDQKIAHLKRLWHKHSIEKIEQFVCKAHNDMQFHCVRCLAYHGWHVQEHHNESL